MGVDIAGSEVFEKQFFYRKWGMRLISSKVYDYRKISQLAGFNAAINRRPLCCLIVGNLESDNILSVLTGYQCGHLRVHVVGVLLISPTSHSFTNNIEK